MSADLLRQAANLIRKRAQAAAPGPWEAYKRNVPEHGGLLVEHLGVQDSYADGVFECDNSSRRDVEHIASWHPLVALAVADWLDATAARHASEYGARVREFGLRHADAFTPDLDENALTVARAYLGGDA